MKQSWGLPSIVYLVHTVYLVIVTNFSAGCPCDELEPGGGSTSHWYYLLIMLIMAMMLMIMVMVIMIMIFMLKICFEEQLGRLSSAVWVGQTTPSLQSSRHSHPSHHSHNHHPCLGTTEFYHNSYHHCNVIITTIIIMVLLTRRHYWTSQCTTLWSDRLTSLTLPWTTSGHNFSSLIKDERMTSSWYRESTDQETGSKDTSFKGSPKPQNLMVFWRGGWGILQIIILRLKLTMTRNNKNSNVFRNFCNIFC